ncbi:hypothetical protein GIB67_021108 [Kingdonia uniflora]|uniref:Uncharacterized protein n=1 Tax=Kingdonia uniflora TaxID=39325 RepID=A0A7J7N6V4_9MAGN|nr:hypothetical protein GIB67_021108 [Kingdonia uniflora]
MGRSSVNEVSTSGRTNESDRKGEEGLEQFSGFSGQLVSYPPCSNAFREFCKAKGAIGGKWGKCVEFVGRQFRGCMVAEEEEYFYLLADLEIEKGLHLTNLVKGVMNTIGACLVQMNGNMWEVITFYGKKNFKASERSYFCAGVTRRRFFDLNSAGRTWNDNIIWVKGNCLQRDDEELLDFRFRSVKQSAKSTVERKEFCWMKLRMRRLN